MRPNRATLVIVYATVFLDLLGFGILLPSLPYYAKNLGASGFLLGLLFSSYSLAQFVGAAVMGRVSDAFGRRPVLLLALAGSAVSMTAAGFANSLLGLGLARSFAGLFGGSISAAQAVIADLTAREERAKYMGLLGAAIGGGFVLGPALGAALLFAGYGFPAAAFCAAGLAALNFLFALAKLPESKPANAGPRPLLPRWASVFTRPALLRLLAASFCSTFAFVGMETTLAYLVKARFELDERGFGGLLVFVGMVAVLVQGGLVGRIAGRIGVGRTAVTGAAVMAGTLAALPFAPTLGLLLATLALLAAGHGLTFPNLSTLLSQASSSEEQGSVLGTGQSASAAARATGPALAGFLYDTNTALPFLVCGALALLTASLIVGAGPRTAHSSP